MRFASVQAAYVLVSICLQFSDTVWCYRVVCVYFDVYGLKLVWDFLCASRIWFCGNFLTRCYVHWAACRLLDSPSLLEVAQGSKYRYMPGYFAWRWEMTYCRFLIVCFSIERRLSGCIAIFNSEDVSGVADKYLTGTSACAGYRAWESLAARVWRIRASVQRVAT